MTMTTDVKGMIAAVEASPHDDTIFGALIDALQESGKSLRGAKVVAGKVRKRALADERMTMAKSAVAADVARSRRLRTSIRAAAGGSGNSTPIVVLPGDFSPRRIGEPAYHTFKNGGVCQYPGSALAKGYKLEYHASTQQIEVGVEWVMGRIDG